MSITPVFEVLECIEKVVPSSGVACVFARRMYSDAAACRYSKYISEAEDNEI
jgi:hypothetical protein